MTNWQVQWVSPPRPFRALGWHQKPTVCSPPPLFWDGATCIPTPCLGPVSPCSSLEGLEIPGITNSDDLRIPGPSWQPSWALSCLAGFPRLLLLPQGEFFVIRVPTWIVSLGVLPGFFCSLLPILQGSPFPSYPAVPWILAMSARAASRVLRPPR